MSAAPGFLQGNGAAYLRIASLAVAGYDYIITLPAEWRFYRNQRGKGWRLSPGCVLFILIRYISFITLVVSNVGYFGHFTKEACSHYYIAAPVFKVIQTIVSQMVLAVRTYNVSRRRRWVYWALISLFVTITAMEGFTNLWNRIPVQRNNNCTPGNTRVSVWPYYLLAMCFDLFTLVVSTYYLIQFTASIRRMTGLIRLMFYDGVGFFVVLTGANIFNLILYRTANEAYQSSGASVGYAVTWIMSQRILIHLRDAASTNTIKNVVISHKYGGGREVSRVVRSHFDSDSRKGGLEAGYDLKERSYMPDGDSGTRRDVELDVQVQVEQTVTVDYISTPYERGMCQPPNTPDRKSRSSQEKSQILPC